MIASKKLRLLFEGACGVADPARLAWQIIIAKYPLHATNYHTYVRESPSLERARGRKENTTPASSCLQPIYYDLDNTLFVGDKLNTPIE